MTSDREESYGERGNFIENMFGEDINDDGGDDRRSGVSDMSRKFRDETVSGEAPESQAQMHSQGPAQVLLRALQEAVRTQGCLDAALQEHGPQGCCQGSGCCGGR